MSWLVIVMLLPAMVIKWSENKVSSRLWFKICSYAAHRAPYFGLQALLACCSSKRSLRAAHDTLSRAGLASVDSEILSPASLQWTVKAFPSVVALADSGAAAVDVAASSVVVGRAFAPIAASVAGAVAPPAVFLRR